MTHDNLNLGEEMEAATPCNLCGSRQVRIGGTRDREGWPLLSVVCQGCGLVWTDPIPSAEELREYYAKRYRLDYKAAYTPRPRQLYRTGVKALERLDRLEKWMKESSKILDLGAGAGVLVYFLRQLGHDAEGLEPNEGYARYAAETLGAPVQTGFYQDHPAEDASLDMVMLFHVLEHLENPKDLFSHVRNWLAPEGRLVIEVPNVEAVCQWPKNRFHRAHLYNFNPASLRQLGRVTGYQPVEGLVTDDGGNLFQVFQKTEASVEPGGEIPGNAERVMRILLGHTAIRHALSPYPYVRPFKKLAERWAETRQQSAAVSPAEILDRLLETRSR